MASRPTTKSSGRQANSREANRKVKEEKKENDEELVVESPKDIQQFGEKEGFGRFEYRNGAVYEGQWKIIKNQRMKHGEGTLIQAGTSVNDLIKEEYRGSWKEDQMEGFGIYKYISGAVYTGEWHLGKHHGRGKYEFPDGTVYEGEWDMHKMHGEGLFREANGTAWEGEFVNGSFQTKLQKKLKHEKAMNLKEAGIKEAVKECLKKLEASLQITDKKLLKDTMASFFAAGNDEIRNFVKDPFPKWEDKKPEQWLEGVRFLMESPDINVLREANNAAIIDQERIIATQFTGNGQIVELKSENPDRKVHLILCSSETNWTIVQYLDQNLKEPEKKPGKK